MRPFCLFILLALIGGCGAPRGRSVTPVLSAASAEQTTMHQPRPVNAMELPMQMQQVASITGPAQVPVAVTPDGRFVLTTDDQGTGLFLTDVDTGTSRPITFGYNSGYYATLSDDGRHVGFKAFRPDREGYQQMALIHDATTGITTDLTGWVRTAGTPRVLADGRSFWAADDRLYAGRFNGAVDARYRLDTTPNIITISPDEGSVVFADSGEQIALLDLAKGTARAVTSGPRAYHSGVMSPDGRHVAGSTINAKVVLVEVATGTERVLGDGENPQWLDNETVLFVEWEGKLRRARLDSSEKAEKVGDIGIRWWALNGPRIASQTKEVIQIAEYTGQDVTKGAALKWQKANDPELAKPTEFPAEMAADAMPREPRLVRNDQAVRIDGIPYVNQMYDIGDAYPGEWACNAVCAVMVLGYHGAIQPRPIDVTRPAPRQSPFGFYITEPYTIGERTFDIASPGPDGKGVTGGYGYIVREDWKDTKHYMRDYFRYHGVGSETDWAPSMAKVRDQVEKQQPFVLLNSITLAGHYVTALGYVPGQRTVIVHDPYGNKNSRYYPTLDGRNVRYDLPGANNGWQNLRVVHCFIYGGEDGTFPEAGKKEGNPGV